MSQYLKRLFYALFNMPYSGDSHFYGVHQRKDLNPDFLKTVEKIENNMKRCNHEYVERREFDVDGYRWRMRCKYCNRMEN